MTQTIDFQFMPTKADYVRAMHAHSMRSWHFWISFIVCGAIFAIGICALIAFEDTLLSCLVLLLPILFLTFLLISEPMRLSRRVQKNERLRTETFWQVSDEHIVIKDKFVKSELDWGTFRKVLETKRYYLFIYSVNKRMFQIVPKRAFESPEQEAAFRDLLKRNITGFG